MRKLSVLRAFTAMAIAACVFSSCKEDQTSLSVDSLPGRAKIMGRLVYDDGRAADRIAANTVVYVKVDNNSIDNNASGVTVRTTTTDAEGYFEYELPTNETGVDVTVEGAQFEGVYYSSYTDSDECIYSGATANRSNVSSNDIVSFGTIMYSSHTLLDY